MQETSNLYKQLLAEDGHTFEVQLLVGEEGSETTIDMDHIGSMRKIGALSETGGLTLGEFPSQALELTLYGVSSSDIPRMGRLRPQIRAVGEDGVTVSEWIDIGVFFVDTRLPVGSVIEITAYDSARKADSQLTSTASSSTASMYAITLWPLLAHKIGVSSTSLPRKFQTSQLTGGDELDVVRSTVGRMAGSFAGNAIISAENKLKLIDPTASPVAEIDEDLIESLGDPLDPVSRVILKDSRHQVGDGVWTDTYGDETGTTVYIEGTRFYVPAGALEYPPARRVWNVLHGYVYTPILAENILMDPALELGDVVTSGETTWMISSIDVEYGRLVVGTLSAPASSEMEHEFPYKDIGDLTAECALRQALDAKESLDDKLETDMTNLPAPIAVAKGGTGQTAAYSVVPATYDTTAGASDHSVFIRLYPYLAACWCRGYCKLSGVAIAANTWITVATVGTAAQPSASYPTPLEVNNTVGGEARITTSCELQVRFYSAMPATGTRYVYFAGWWTV